MSLLLLVVGCINCWLAYNIREKVKAVVEVMQFKAGSDAPLTSISAMKRELESPEYQEFLKQYNCGGYHD